MAKDNNIKKLKIKVKPDLQDEGMFQHGYTGPVTPQKKTFKTEGYLADSDVDEYQRTPVKEDGATFSSPHATPSNPTTPLSESKQRPVLKSPFFDTRLDAINGYLAELHAHAEAESNFRNGRKHYPDVARKDILHKYFGKYHVYEDWPEFSDDLKHEWQKTLVELVTAHNRELDPGRWITHNKVGHQFYQGMSKHPGSIDDKIMRKRKGWFEEFGESVEVESGEEDETDEKDEVDAEENVGVENHAGGTGLKNDTEEA